MVGNIKRQHGQATFRVENTERQACTEKLCTMLDIRNASMIQAIGARRLMRSTRWENCARAVTQNGNFRVVDGLL